MSVDANYTSAVSEPVFFDPAACHRAAIRACITFRRLANQAAREGNLTEHTRLIVSLNWHRDRARIWKELARAELEA